MPWQKAQLGMTPTNLSYLSCHGGVGALKGIWIPAASRIADGLPRPRMRMTIPIFIVIPGDNRKTLTPGESSDSVSQILEEPCDSHRSGRLQPRLAPRFTPFGSSALLKSKQLTFHSSSFLLEDELALAIRSPAGNECRTNAPWAGSGPFTRGFSLFLAIAMTMVLRPMPRQVAVFMANSGRARGVCLGFLKRAPSCAIL